MNLSSAELISYGSIPVISALIGWVTNYIAVKMIFRPRIPWRILGITFQGLVPKRQRELALNMGETIESNLISHRDVQAALKSPDIEEELKKLVETQIDQFLQKQLVTMPMIGMFLKGEMLEQVKSMLVNQFQLAAPDIIEHLLVKLESKLSFKDLVREKVESFDLGKLEEIIYRISARELKAIELLGGVLGFVIGVGQVVLLVALGQS